MSWQRISAIPKLGDECFERDGFVLTIRHSQLYVLWNLFRRRGADLAPLDATYATPHALFDLEAGLKWADGQLVEFQKTSP